MILQILIVSLNTSHVVTGHWLNIRLKYVFHGYREINGFSLCFKTRSLSVATVSGQPTAVPKEQTTTDGATQPERQTSVHTVQVQPLDDLTFKLNEKNDAKLLLEKVVIVSHSASSIPILYSLLGQRLTFSLCRR